MIPTVINLSLGLVLSPCRTLDLPATWSDDMQPLRFRVYTSLLLSDKLGVL